MSDQPTPHPKPPTPADIFFEEWRNRICPVCSYPLDLQQKMSGPILWLCPMCRKWFDEELKPI
jgi:hypothetical protein